jgi:hypothetical protein
MRRARGRVQPWIFALAEPSASLDGVARLRQRRHHGMDPLVAPRAAAAWRHLRHHLETDLRRTPRRRRSLRPSGFGLGPPRAPPLTSHRDRHRPNSARVFVAPGLGSAKTLTAASG